jgi:hypothetical protein
MRILFDEGTPVPLRRSLVAHAVQTAQERGWSGLRNGELIAAAEAAGFEVFVTTDQNLRYQQKLDSRRLAVIVLCTTSWPRIQRSLFRVVAAIDSAAPGHYVEVPIE